MDIRLIEAFEDDLKEVPAQIRDEFNSRLDDAKRDGHFVGKRLEWRDGTECLEGLFKCYLGGATYRAVFLEKNEHLAFIAIGARDNGYVYRQATARVRELLNFPQFSQSAHTH